MFNFIYRILIVLIFTVICQFVLLTYFEFYETEYDKTYIRNSCFCEDKLTNTKYILGNSHVETGLNDTILGVNYCNLGKNAEPIFYTVIKAREIINSLKVDTIVIEYSNYSLVQEDQVISNERCFQNYQNFFKYLNYDEHLLIWKHNFFKALKTFYSMRRWHFIKTSLIGGYAPQVGFRQVDFLNRTREENKTYKSQFAIKPLFELINKNPRVVFILFRSPIKNGHLFNESEFLDLIESLKKLNNVRFYDLKDSIKEDRYFYDNNHLNYEGSILFTNLFKNFVF